MASGTQAKTITTSAARIDQGTGNMAAVAVRAASDPEEGVIYVGGADVTSSNGFPVRFADGEVYVRDAYNPAKAPLYAVTASGTVVVRVETLD